MNSDEGAMVPRPEATESNSMVVPKDITFEGIAKALDDSDLGWLDKLALARDKTRGLIALRKKEMDAALQTADVATTAKVNVAAKAIALYRETCEFEIRHNYVQMFASLGMTVELEQLEFSADFGQQLDDFEKSLSGMNMRPEFRERILKSIGKTFTRLCDKLDDMTEEIVREAQRKKRAQ